MRGLVGEQKRVGYIGPPSERRIGLDENTVAPTDGRKQRVDQVLLGDGFARISDGREFSEERNGFVADFAELVGADRLPPRRRPNALEQKVARKQSAVNQFAPSNRIISALRNQNTHALSDYGRPVSIT